MSTCDVLVIGSGAGGLSTAVTAAHFGARVIVVEKHHQVGGTSAWSGGWLWIPRNPLAVAAGIVEDDEAPMRYLRAELGNRASDPRLPVYLQVGPEMVRFFRDHTAVEWIDGNRVPDFHMSEGARDGGRSVCAAPFDGRELGEWAARLRPPLEVASLWGMGIAAGQDMAHFFNAKRHPGSALHVARRIGRHAADVVRNGRGSQLVNGNALVARLLKSAIDLGVDIRLSAAAEALIECNGRVIGARVAGQDLQASSGVVLAAGGFPHDRGRIAALFPHAPTGTEHHSAAPPENTGDGLRLAETVGGQCDEDLTEPGAWAPVSLVPTRAGVARFPHLVERAKPGFILVGPDGRRFANEANSYHDVMKALFRTYSGTPHAWLVGDAAAVARFGIGAVKPWPFPKTRHIASGYLHKAKTIAKLAQFIGLPNTVLAQTLKRFNSHAARGEDPEFGRGTSPYNRIQGDGGQSVRPLDSSPFYAVKIVPGSLGTFVGLKTTADAQVLDRSNRPIPGLYAVGNDAASIMGGHYPSGGVTLGPAMTFGYIAGRVLSGQPIRELDQKKEQAFEVL